MDITERFYRNVEKHAVKICFVLAVILASICLLYTSDAADEL